MAQLPAWAQLFNERKLPQTLTKNDLHTLYLIDTYKQIVAGKSVFPQLLNDAANKTTVNVSNTPCALIR